MNSTYEFKIAKKMITSPDQIDKFMKSSTAIEILQFITALQKSIEGKNKYETSIPEVII